MRSPRPEKPQRSLLLAQLTTAHRTSAPPLTASLTTPQATRAHQWGLCLLPPPAHPPLFTPDPPANLHSPQMARLSSALPRLLTLLSCAAALLPSVLAQSFVSFQGFMPISLTFDSAGRLWVLDQASYAVIQLSPTTGAEISRVDVSQLSPQIECPNVLRIDGQGRFIIADGCSNVVYVVSARRRSAALPHHLQPRAVLACRPGPGQRRLRLHRRRGQSARGEAQPGRPGGGRLLRPALG